MPAGMLRLAGGFSGQQVSCLLPQKEGDLGNMLEWGVRVQFSLWPMAPFVSPPHSKVADSSMGNFGKAEECVTISSSEFAL